MSLSMLLRSSACREGVHDQYTYLSCKHREISHSARKQSQALGIAGLVPVITTGTMSTDFDSPLEEVSLEDFEDAWTSEVFRRKGIGQAETWQIDTLQVWVLFSLTQ